MYKNMLYIIEKSMPFFTFVVIVVITASAAF